MNASKPWTPTSLMHKTPGVGSFTSKTRPRGLTPIDFRNTFCTGLCTEAACLDDLCSACVNEYHEYKESRHE